MKAFFHGTHFQPLLFLHQGQNNMQCRIDQSLDSFSGSGRRLVESLPHHNKSTQLQINVSKLSNHLTAHIQMLKKTKVICLRAEVTWHCLGVHYKSVGRVHDSRAIGRVFEYRHRSATVISFQRVGTGYAI